MSDLVPPEDTSLACPECGATRSKNTPFRSVRAVRVHLEKVHGRGRDARPCRVDGCDRPVGKRGARGFCCGHYSRFRRHGDPGPADFKKPSPQIGPCSVNGCENPKKTSDLCSGHYSRLKTCGDTMPDKPLRKMRSFARYSEEELSYISDRSLTASEVASLTGIKRGTVSGIRQRIDKGSFSTSDWLDSEVDYIVEKAGRMTTARIAAQLGRPEQEVDIEVERLRRNGVIGDRGLSNKNPAWVGHRPLIAKTCPSCGLLLGAEWFPWGGHGWAHDCKKCKGDRKNAVSKERYAKEKTTGQQRSIEIGLAKQRYTADRAVNRFNRWTEADIAILADRSLSIFDKALKLGRTYYATQQKYVKEGLSTFEPISDPEEGEWKIFRAADSKRGAA